MDGTGKIKEKQGYSDKEQPSKNNSYFAKHVVIGVFFANIRKKPKHRQKYAGFLTIISDIDNYLAILKTGAMAFVSSFATTILFLGAVLQIIRLFIVDDVHISIEMITLFKKKAFFLN